MNQLQSLLICPLGRVFQAKISWGVFLQAASVCSHEMRIAHQELFHSRKKAELKPNTKSVAALKE